MYTEYNGELTLMQLLRIMKRGLLKWIISVAAAFVVTFTVTYSIFCAQTVTGYTLSLTHTIAPTNPDAEIATMISLENIKEGLENAGYTEEEISGGGMAEKISENLSAYVDSGTGSYVLYLSGKPLKRVSDEKYNLILDEIAGVYTAKYPDNNTYLLPSNIGVDVSGLDYIAAADYLSDFCDDIIDSVSTRLSNAYVSHYADSETGYTFYDILNMFDALSSEIDLFRIYVESNAALRSGANVSAKEYISSKLVEAESAYSAAARNYNTLADVFNQGKKITDSDVIEAFAAASSALGEAESDLTSWRGAWVAFGGTVVYNDDGSASYSSENFVGSYSASAESLLSEAVSSVNSAFSLYNGVAKRYNATVISGGQANISSYSAKSVSYGMSSNLLVIINIAAVCFAFAIANAHTYAKMRKNGEFRMPELAEPEKEKSPGENAEEN